MKYIGQEGGLGKYQLNKQERGALEEMFSLAGQEQKSDQGFQTLLSKLFPRLEVNGPYSFPSRDEYTLNLPLFGKKEVTHLSIGLKEFYPQHKIRGWIHFVNNPLWENLGQTFTMINPRNFAYRLTTEHRVLCDIIQEVQTKTLPENEYLIYFDRLDFPRVYSESCWALSETTRISRIDKLEELGSMFDRAKRVLENSRDYTGYNSFEIEKIENDAERRMPNHHSNPLFRKMCQKEYVDVLDKLTSAYLQQEGR